MIPLTDFLVTAAIIGLAIIALLGAVVAVFWAIDASKDHDSAAIGRVLADIPGVHGGGHHPATMALVAPVFIGVLFFASKTAIQYVSHPMIRVVAGTLGIVLLSAALFALKVFGLRVYAALEFLFALAVTATTLWKLGDVIQPVEALSLLTAAYLLIRAMDNFKKGTEEARKKKEAKARESANDSGAADGPR